MSSFRLQCLDSNADRISVQSTERATWAPQRRAYKFLPAKKVTVPLMRDEVVIIKTRGDNAVRIFADSPDHHLVVRSSRHATEVLQPGNSRLFNMADGEALVIRHENARDPERGHRIPAKGETV
jgi:hypothetical protein